MNKIRRKVGRRRKVSFINSMKNFFKKIVVIWKRLVYISSFIVR